jgi:periplasmic divalent cation tolerance protein
MTNHQPAVILVTAASQQQAAAIAQALVEAKLAACVNLFPIHSVYAWEGAIQQNEEWQLMIKSDLSHFAALDALIRDRHSYEVPEIIALPIVAGSSAYLQWLASNLARGN